MEERIQRELSGKKPSEIQDLLLDNCKATNISGLTEEFNNLTTLSLINVGLTSLDGLPKLPTLRTIDLSDNKLSGGLEKLVQCCPRLYHINLCANKIETLDTLTPLKNLEELSALDLFDCSVTELPQYRSKVFQMIPHLKYLDGFDINDVEADLSEEGDEGAEGLEDEADSLDDEMDSGEDEALAYLNSSKALQDEDDSADYVDKQNAAMKVAGINVNGGEKKNGQNAPTVTISNEKLAPPAGNPRKRKMDGPDGGVADGEPEAKV